jgi:pimeloyl-ACP methyl ester carboxylesterase
MLHDASPADQAVMDDPAWQRVHTEDVTEALRPGAEGWADEVVAVAISWDFDPSNLTCSLTWWHGKDDHLAPIRSVRRFVAQMPEVDLRVWKDEGHFASVHRHDEILKELLAR